MPNSGEGGGGGRGGEPPLLLSPHLTLRSGGTCFPSAAVLLYRLKRVPPAMWWGLVSWGGRVTVSTTHDFFVRSSREGEAKKFRIWRVVFDFGFREGVRVHNIYPPPPPTLFRMAVDSTQAWTQSASRKKSRRYFKTFKEPRNRFRQPM